MRSRHLDVRVQSGAGGGTADPSLLLRGSVVSHLPPQPTKWTFTVSSPTSLTTASYHFLAESTASTQSPTRIRESSCRGARDQAADGDGRVSTMRSTAADPPSRGEGDRPSHRPTVTGSRREDLVDECDETDRDDRGVCPPQAPLRGGRGGRSGGAAARQSTSRTS